MTVIKRRAAFNIRLLPQNQTFIMMSPESRAREENTDEIFKRGASVACKKNVMLSHNCTFQVNIYFVVVVGDEPLVGHE